MIPYNIVLILGLGVNLLDFSNGQFGDPFNGGGGLQYVNWNNNLDMKSNLQNWYTDYDCASKCIAANCRTTIYNPVCDPRYGNSNCQYVPGSPLSASNYQNQQYPAAGDQSNAPNQANFPIPGSNPQASALNGVNQLFQKGAENSPEPTAQGIARKGTKRQGNKGGCNKRKSGKGNPANQVLDNQGLQGSAWPTDPANWPADPANWPSQPQNGNSDSDAPVQSSQLPANQIRKEVWPPKGGIEADDDVDLTSDNGGGSRNVLRNDGRLEINRDGKFIRDLGPFNK